jgi:hypothetical protein
VLRLLGPVPEEALHHLLCKPETLVVRRFGVAQVSSIHLWCGNKPVVDQPPLRAHMQSSLAIVSLADDRTSAANVDLRVGSMVMLSFPARHQLMVYSSSVSGRFAALQHICRVSDASSACCRLEHILRFYLAAAPELTSAVNHGVTTTGSKVSRRTSASSP